jgi:hypothetical protein
MQRLKACASEGDAVKSASVFMRALVYGAIVIFAIALVGSVVGFLVAGWPGVLSALAGAGVTALFMGFTTLSVIIADRSTRESTSPSNSRYFAIVIGMWGLKFVLFIVILVAVSGQAWLSPYVFLFVLIAAVIGSLVVDMIALQGARVPYVGDVDLAPAQGSTLDASKSAI